MVAQHPPVLEARGQAGAAPASLPRDHPQRQALNDEVHARPPESLAAPLRASYVALLGDAAQREAALDAVRDLARRSGAASLPAPPTGTSASPIAKAPASCRPPSATPIFSTAHA